jgi:hypothetical protein
MGLSLGCVPRPGPRPVLDDTAGQLLHHRPQPGMGKTDAIFYVFDMGQDIAFGIGSSGEAMQQEDNRIQWEHAAPWWARWEATVVMAPATEAMLAMAGVDTGARVLDLACGAGS